MDKDVIYTVPLENNNVRCQEYCIYSIDYLANGKLTRKQRSLLNNDGYSLIASLIVGELMFNGTCKTPKECIDLITTEEKWFQKYSWTYDKEKEYEEISMKVMKNVCRFNKKESRKEMSWFFLMYGLSISDSEKIFQ